MAVTMILADADERSHDGEHRDDRRSRQQEPPMFTPPVPEPPGRQQRS
jgi:hypothetical protein